MASSHGGYVGRFAPSPTGPLHFGSLVAAVASYLDARAQRGRWIIRIEDVDETRSKPEFADDILRTLAAFGLRADGEVMTQSSRKQRYADALAVLAHKSLVYGCRCGRREVSDSGIAGIDGPVYPGTCRKLSLPLSGHAVRFVTSAGDTTFTDRLQGRQTQTLQTDVGDFVVQRKDGLAAYQLAVVVDDFDQGVTDIVRGADLLDSTARQIALQRALGYPTPRYLHIPVVTNNDGEKLSKQTLATPIGAADEANRVERLRQALAFLSQPLPSSKADNGRVSALLAAATASWQPAAIAASRARPMP